MSKPDAELVRLVRRCNAEAESRHRVDEVAFMKIMEEVRRNGYAVTTGYFAPGRRSIAVPIPSRTDRVPFAVGVAATIERIEAKREQILQALRAFQAAALDSDFVNDDNLAAAPLMTTGAASEAPRPAGMT